MTKKIYKYTIEEPDHGLTISISMRRNCQVLSAQYQPATETLCIWAVVDTEEPVELKTFFIAGTGLPIPDIQNGSLCFIATVQAPKGNFVWHVFEVTGDWSIAA